MITVAVAGGSRDEIVALVKEANKNYPNLFSFIVFDYVDDINSDDLWTYVSCMDEQDVAKQAIKSVANGEAEILLKGIIQTHTLLKELLKKEYNLKTQEVLSHIARFTFPDKERSFLLTDSAMAISPDKVAMEGIVNNALFVARKIGISHPKVALLSSAENYNPKMPSSVLAKEITEKFENQDDCTVFGPLSFDLAVSKEAVAHKRYTGPIMGDADILAVPNIDTGNSLYKALTLFAGATVGGALVGTKVPVVLTSRSDSTKSKLDSLLFAKQLV